MNPERGCGHKSLIQYARGRGIVLTSGEQAISVRPVFIGWIALLIQLPLQLFFTIWCAVFFGGMLQASGLFIGSPRLAGAQVPFIIFGAIGFFRRSRRRLSGQEAQLQPHRISLLHRSPRIRGGLLLDQQKSHPLSRRERSHVAQGHFSAHLRSRHDLSCHAGDRDLGLGISVPSARSASAMCPRAASASATSPIRISMFEKIRQLVDAQRG